MSAVLAVPRAGNQADAAAGGCAAAGMGRHDGDVATAVERARDCLFTER